MSSNSNKPNFTISVPGPPAAIKVLVSSGTSILISWKRPDEPNGEISHYTVYIKPVSR